MGILPSIDMAATGINIAQMRQRSGMTVQDLQNIFGFSTPQAIYVLAAVFGTTLDSIIVRTGTADQTRSA